MEKNDKSNNDDSFYNVSDEKTIKIVLETQPQSTDATQGAEMEYAGEGCSLFIKLQDHRDSNFT